MPQNARSTNKRIAIIIPYEMSARAILTPQFQSLLNSTRYIEYHIISTSSACLAFNKPASKGTQEQNVKWSEIYQPRHPKEKLSAKLTYALGSFVYLCMTFRLQRMNGSGYLRAHSTAGVREKFKSLAEGIPIFTMFGFPFPKSKRLFSWMARFYELITKQNSQIITQLANLELDGLVIAHCQNHKSNSYAMAAKRLNLPVKGIITSWDQPTTRGPIINAYSSFAVQSPYVKRQLNLFHGIDLCRIHIVGMPYLNSLWNKTSPRRVNGSKVILFALYPDRLGSHEIPIAEEILKHLESKHPTAQLLLRPHPNDKDFLSRLTPRIVTGRNCRILTSSFNDIESYISLLRRSNCVVCTGGSSNIEAPIFGLPSLSIDFCLKKTTSQHIGRRYQLEHLAEADQRNFFYRMTSLEQLLTMIDMCLADKRTKNAVQTVDLHWLLGSKARNTNERLRDFMINHAQRQS